jgi:hypothetical protein
MTTGMVRNAIPIALLISVLPPVKTADAVLLVLLWPAEEVVFVLEFTSAAAILS